jgi:hypothetical protein
MIKMMHLMRAGVSLALTALAYGFDPRTRRERCILNLDYLPIWTRRRRHVAHAIRLAASKLEPKKG